MMEFLQHLFAFVFALGVLITFHEFGHYWVAKRCNVKILRFSIGFGQPLWKKTFSKDRTELVVAALPLGGYVKMLDEREGSVSLDELHRAFNRKPLKQRFAIVLAGPLFNFLFAIMAYWVMYMVGISGMRPLIGAVEPGSIASEAGIRADSEILAVDGESTATWTMVVDKMIDNIVDNKNIKLLLNQPGSGQREAWIDTSQVTIDDLAESGLLKKLGMTPRQYVLPAVIGEVQAGLPAEAAGLKPGDRVIEVNGSAVSDWVGWVEYIQAHPEQVLNVTLERDGSEIIVQLIPQRKTTENGETIGFIGAANLPPEGLFATESYSLFPAFFKSLERTWDMSWLTLKMLGKMITGQASIKNLSGPISIAQYAGDSAESGVAAFLWFLAIVSISLGVLNLLPIPLLDGGHLLYYLIESVKGTPVSESAQIIGQQIGLFLLLSLMVLVFYNDIMRMLG